MMAKERKRISLWVALGLVGSGLLLAATGTEALPLGAYPGESAVFYVAGISGDDAHPCSSSQPCRTIQRAVDLAQEGDEIHIATSDGLGTPIYTGTGDAAVVTLNEGLTLRGGYAYDPLFHTWWPTPFPAPLDGEGVRRTLYVSGDVTPTLELLILRNGHAGDGGNAYLNGSNTRLLGLVIEGGTATRGGGLYLRDSAALLSAVLVQGNQAVEGGGLYVEGGSTSLAGSIVQENTAERGGGGYGLDSAVRAVGTLVISNTATEAGGGFYLDGPFTIWPTDIPILTNNYIRHNQAAAGAGLYIRLALAGLVNNVIADNQATGHGGGLYLHAASPLGFHNTLAQNVGSDGLYLTHQPGSLWPPMPPIPSHPLLTNTVVVSHAVGIYVDTTDWFPPLENKATLRGTLWWGNGEDTAGPGDVDLGNTNVYSAPLFTCMGDPPFCLNPYHLRNASPAVDAGVPIALTLPGTDLFIDIDGQLRPSGKGYDLGADEVVQPGGVWLIPPVSALVANAGQSVTHTHRLLNSGTSTDTYTLTLTADPPWSVLMTPGPIELGPQTSTTVSVRVTVPETATAGMTETALLSATSWEEPLRQAWALEETAVITAAWSDLEVEKSAERDTIAPGEAARFTLVMTNAGPFSEAIAVTLTDIALPITAVAGIGAPPGCTPDAATAHVTCTLFLPAGTPPVSAGLELVFTTTSTYTGPLLNNGWLTGDVFDPNPTNNLAQALVTVGQPPPQIGVTPTQVALTLTAGLSATRPITIANEGGRELVWGPLLEAPPAGWLTEEPLSGTVPAGAPPQVVELTLDSAGLGEDAYSTTLVIPNNDPERPLVTVTVAMTVLPPCQAVTETAFSWQPSNPTAGQPVTFTAEAGGSAPIAFVWDLGDGTGDMGTPVTHTYASGGDFEVILTATNGCGRQVVTQTVTVCAPVQGAGFIWEPPFPAAGAVVTFSASAGGSPPIDFAWELGDGHTASGVVVTHTYAVSGTYTVTLTATNGCGGQTVARSIVVGATGEVRWIYLPLVSKDG